MVSQDDNCFDNLQTREELPHVSRTLGDKWAKLLADAQRMAKARLVAS